MASFENLATLESWTFRPSFADNWISDAFNRDTEALTKALQKSLSAGNTEPLVSDNVSPFLGFAKPESASTPTLSGVSGSDQEPAPKRQRTATPASTGKAAKRKSRASKRSQTTYITADPANFRQMVQQVTGVRFGGAGVQMVAPVLKPEPQRGGVRYYGGGGGCLLPTLDTSAFLLDHQQQQQVGPHSLAEGAVSGGGGAGSALDFDTFSSFPTLESWKVM